MSPILSEIRDEISGKRVVTLSKIFLTVLVNSLCLAAVHVGILRPSWLWLVDVVLRLKILYCLYHVPRKILRGYVPRCRNHVRMCELSCPRHVLLTCPVSSQVMLHTPCFQYDVLRLTV